MKIYSEIELNENHKAIECPICGNSHVVEGDYCQICGSLIVNRCTNTETDEYNELKCGELLSGGSRYCPWCGYESTFLQKGYLDYHDGTYYYDNEISF